MALTSEEAKKLAAKVKNHNGGRPKREKEETIIRALDKQMPIAKVIEKLAARVDLLDLQAILAWLAYRFGKPTETVKHEGAVGLVVKTIMMLPPKVDPG